MKAIARYRSVAGENPEDRVTQHATLVKRIAYHLVSRLPPSVQVDDLIQAGMIGLIEASRHYDARAGASFETYAGIRIRGAMLDEIRRNDWAPRSVHRRSREVSRAIHAVEMKQGRAARDQEVAEQLGVTLEEYSRVLMDEMGARVFSLDDGNDDDDRDRNDTLASDCATPQEEMLQDGFRDALRQAIQALPERERLALSLYYDEELNLKEIGAVLGVSESRVSQIHSQAVLRIKARLGDWRE